ncbi:Murein hydrolase activator NlpD [Candidatus Hartigia pinicola]|nr:Murein hydrolase activator NlpD [Candidatus Hartigia pinicola]
MKIISLIIRIRWAVIFLFNNPFLSACSTPYYRVATISSVYESQGIPINQHIVKKRATLISNTRTVPLASPLSTLSNSKSSIHSSITIDSTKRNRIIYHRDYDRIPKASYHRTTYTVKHGDTLFYIAYITGNNFRELASNNKLSEPYRLHVGQILHIDNKNKISRKELILNSLNSNQRLVDLRKTNKYTQNLIGHNSVKILINNKNPITQSAKMTRKQIDSTISNKVQHRKNSSSIKWCWPAQGKIIESFSNSQGGNKGFDLSGLRGQSIFASAPGKVVYAGNALRGYGNLVIIKHNNDYLSAYAHNDTLLVHDQQRVNGGQKIATMGKTGSSLIKLHFEIRYKGKSVNPLLYLPKRHNG